MKYPKSMTENDIMEFEYEYERWLDSKEPWSLISINAECQIVSDQLRSIDIDSDDYEIGADDFDYTDEQRWPLKTF